MFIVSFLGYCGALRESRCLLTCVSITASITVLHITEQLQTKYAHPSPSYKLTYIAGRLKQCSGTAAGWLVSLDSWVNEPQLAGMKTVNQTCLDNRLTAILCHYSYQSETRMQDHYTCYDVHEDV